MKWAVLDLMIAAFFLRRWGARLEQRQRFELDAPDFAWPTCFAFAAVALATLLLSLDTWG